MAAAFLPALPSLAGTAVVPWVFAALVAAYGVSALVKYAITENTLEDKCYPQNVCAGGSGHCRDPYCFSHEVPLIHNADVCGGACPCCVTPEVYRRITGRDPFGK